MPVWVTTGTSGVASLFSMVAWTLNAIVLLQLDLNWWFELLTVSVMGRELLRILDVEFSGESFYSFYNFQLVKLHRFVERAERMRNRQCETFSRLKVFLSLYSSESYSISSKKWRKLSLLDIFTGQIPWTQTLPREGSLVEDCNVMQPCAHKIGWEIPDGKNRLLWSLCLASLSQNQKRLPFWGI